LGFQPSNRDERDDIDVAPPWAHRRSQRTIAIL
jgi:hypothetical protein